jgi:hypothetical protein
MTIEIEVDAEAIDARDEKIGAKLAEVLQLRRDKDRPDRWQTTWGSKTNKGLARTVQCIIEEGGEE